jgi:hypothetical protein
MMSGAKNRFSLTGRALAHGCTQESGPRQLDPNRVAMNCSLWTCVLAFGSFLGPIAMAQSPGPSASNKPDQGVPEMRRVTVDISKLSGTVTTVGYHHTNRPPWPYAPLILETGPPGFLKKGTH